MLYLETPDAFVPWTGQTIADVRYPSNIEELWTPQALAAIGLYSPVDPGVPDGKIATGFTVQRVDGTVTKVYVLEDAPPVPLPDLAPYQFFSMLDLSGKKAALDTFIAALPSPQGVIARNKLDHTLVFQRTNDLVLAAQQGLNLTDQELDALWTQAASIT